MVSIKRTSIFKQMNRTEREIIEYHCQCDHCKNILIQTNESKELWGTTKPLIEKN